MYFVSSSFLYDITRYKLVANNAPTAAPPNPPPITLPASAPPTAWLLASFPVTVSMSIILSHSKVTS